MCQSKASGGKRCFAHHPGTKASIAYVHLKTGIDKEQIYAIMKELRKEGKNLGAPTPEELEKYFSLEEFKTKYDASLSDQEKVAILKQLLSARAEAEREGVSGGIFHSWKNSLKRSIERFKRPLVALGLSSVLLLSACTGQNGVTPSPSDSNAPTEPGTVACSTENPGSYGDVIAKEEVTDEFGAYCRTTIDPNSDALRWDESKVDMASLEEHGFTVEEAKEAQKTAVTFAAEQTFDSTRLDNYSQSPADWINENASSLSNPSIYLDFVKNEKLANTGLVVTDYLPSPIVRDGGPRATQTNLQINRIYGFESEGKKAIGVEIGANAFYGVENEEIVKLYLANNPDLTEESLKQTTPELFAEEPANLSVQGSFSYSFVKGTMDKIAGTRAQWSVTTQTGTPIIE